MCFFAAVAGRLLQKGQTLLFGEHTQAYLATRAGLDPGPVFQVVREFLAVVRLVRLVRGRRCPWRFEVVPQIVSNLQTLQAVRLGYLLDEPTTGLHFAYIKKLLDVLDRLVARG